MNVVFKGFGFYNVDLAYLQYLNKIDSEVRFDQDKAYDHKPFLGIIVFIEGRDYLIPLTSGKLKHKTWKNVGEAHYLVYEIVSKKDLRPKDIYKPYSPTEVMKVLAALDIKKMIPVKEGVYSAINFDLLEDKKYADLLEKEYRFCQKIQDGILAKAKQIYFEQKLTGKVHNMYCNFAKLEAACDTYQRPE